MAHTLWRNYDSLSGRWTGPDPYGGSMTIADPQSLNRYSYVNNDPVNQADPLGLMADASQGYGAFGGWGGEPGLFDPHFGGPGIIAEAEAKRDDLVQARIDGKLALKYLRDGNTEAANRIFKNNSNVGRVNEDGEVLWGADAAGNYSVTVSAEITGMAGDPQHIRPTNAQSVDSGPYIFPAVADNPTIFMDSLGTSQCATWAQLVAIGLNQPL